MKRLLIIGSAMATGLVLGGCQAKQASIPSPTPAASSLPSASPLLKTSPVVKASPTTMTVDEKTLTEIDNELTQMDVQKDFPNFTEKDLE